MAARGLVALRVVMVLRQDVVACCWVCVCCVCVVCAVLPVQNAQGGVMA